MFFFDEERQEFDIDDFKVSTSLHKHGATRAHGGGNKT